jgi:regulator of protease activity HflC (stomatin/prohibitin superfamily)
LSKELCARPRRATRQVATATAHLAGVFWLPADNATARVPAAIVQLEAETFMPLFVVALLVSLIIVLAGLRVANQYERAVVFRFGRYQGTRGPGLYWLIPVAEWQSKVDLRVITAPVEQQETITKDNVPIKVNAVIWYRIVDPKSARLEVRDVANAVIQVALTTLRIVLGQHTLDDVLKEQETISGVMQSKIDSVTEPWGVKVERVEMKNVEIPDSMQRAMAQEAEALREKRARLIKAQAELEAAEQLRAASETIMQSPAGLELRRMQMITEVGAEQNTTTIIMMPSEFVNVAGKLAEMFGRRGGGVC